MKTYCSRCPRAGRSAADAGCAVAAARGGPAPRPSGSSPASHGAGRRACGATGATRRGAALQHCNVWRTGARLDSTFLGRKSTAAQAGRASARPAWSFPGFLPGEPAPDQAAHGLAGPARPCGAFREPSRPMSDSKPRRGEARRHTQDPGFGVKRGGVLGAKGCINGGAAKRFRCAAAPAGFDPRRAKRAGLCECAMRKRMNTPPRAMTPAVRRVAKRPAAGGSRDGAVCGKPESARFRAR
jgi:hypothetical protein